MEWFRSRANVTRCRPGGRDDVREGLMNIRYRRRSLWSWGDGRVVDDLTRQELKARLLNANSERLWWLATDFEVWDDEASVCQADFNDRPDAYHAIGVVAGEGKARNKGKLRVLNPLCDRLKWVPIDTVMDAAQRYAREHPGRIDALSIKPPDREEI
jgi:hypothetical protein